LGGEFKSSCCASRKYPALLFATYLLFGLAYSSYSYQLRYYAEEGGISYSLQSMLESLSYLGVAPFILMIGRASDAIGREKAVMISSLAGALSPIFAISSRSPTMFFLSVLALNSSFLGGAVARNLLAIEVGGIRTGTVVGIAMGGTAVAMIIGPIAGDLVRSSLGYPGVFAFSSLMFASSAASSSLIKTGARGRAAGGFGVSSIPKKLRRFALFATLDRFTYYTWVPLIFALMASEGIPAESSALLYSVQNAAWLALQFPFGILADRVRPEKLLSFSEITTSASAVFLSLGIAGGGSPFLSTAFALLGVNIASWAPGYSSYFMKRTESWERGKYMASINFYATLAAIPSPFIGGFLRSHIPGGFGHLIFAAALHTLNAFIILRKR